MKKLEQYPPLVLAYIGDAIYELRVREMLASKTNLPVDKLHKSAVSYVRASGQRARFEKIKDCLTEQEYTVFKRGRNTKSTVPKNADMHDYRIATGLEALLGYIYLSNDQQRLDELMNLLLED